MLALAMGIDDLLEQARAGLDRMSPHQAASAIANGALMVDTRDYEQRRDHEQDATDDEPQHGAYGGTVTSGKSAAPG